MHTVAKRCLIWAAVLAVAGSFVFAATSVLFDQMSGFFGSNFQFTLYVVNFVTHVVGGFGLPLAAVLVGAAIVIQTLAPHQPPQVPPAPPSRTTAP